MKKSVIIMFITAVIISMITAWSINAADKQALTSEFLSSGKWEISIGEMSDPASPECRGEATFSKDGHFIFKRDCGDNENRIDCSGIYKIKGDKLSFTIEKSPDGTFFNKGYTGYASIVDSDSLKYRWAVKFDKMGILYNKNNLIKEGESFLVEGIDAIAMGEKSGTVTTPLKVREKPDTSAKEVTFCECADVDGLTDCVKLKSLKNGTDLIIYARTKEKKSVGKWNNYWYYVEFSFNGCEGRDDYYGWVFGEFVKIK